MTTIAMTKEECDASGIQRLYDNGAYVVEACYEMQDHTSATLVFFVDDASGKNIAQSSEYNEAKRLADEMAKLETLIAA